MTDTLSRRSILKIGLGAVSAPALKWRPMRGRSPVAVRPRPAPAFARGDLWRLGALDLAAAIRAREVSSREVVEAHLARITAVNGRTNAVTVVLGDEALAAADAADRSLAHGEPLAALHGVPMTIKENIDLAGSATTEGVPALRSAVPAIDAPQIAQLKAAGAIPIGRTNLPDFGLRWHTDSSLHGPTVNPWDPTRTPGGSSGGEAAELATGMTPLGCGNDYGGSLRYPAQCCAVASIRPSRGRVPYASALSPGEPLPTFRLFAVQGPMARHVRDLRAALLAMSGPDPRDPTWVPAPPAGPAPPGPLRVAVASSAGLVEPSVAAGVRSAARVLEQAGYVVEEAEPPAVDEAADLWLRLVAAEVRSVIDPQIRPMLSEGARRFLDLAFRSVPALDLAGYMEALARCTAIARRWAVFAERFPLIVGPVSTAAPFPIGLDIAGENAAREMIATMRLVVTCSLLGVPAVVVPVGMGPQGLPLAVQIVAPIYREDLCLDAAEIVENALGTLTPIDPRGGAAGQNC